MPSGNKVIPKKWSNVIDLFDDGYYSVIWGNYKSSNNKPSEKCLGVRWNNGGSKNLGFPNQSGYPIWYVEPDFLLKTILTELLNKVKKSNKLGNLANIQQALSEV